MLERYQQLPVWLRRVVLFLFGLTNSFAYAPYNLYFIPFITLPLLLLELKATQNKRGAFITGFGYGLGWFAAGISWVHVSIDTFGGLPLVASLALMALLAAYLSLYPALATLATYRLSDQKQWWISFPVFWLITEYFRGVVLTGFPWLSLGYSQFESPLAALAPLIGEVGITFIMCLIAVQLKQLLCADKRARHAATIGLTFVVAFSLQQVQWTKPTGETKKIALVQGNIKQELKWAPENDWPTLLKYMDMSRPHYADSDLIIWPEAAIPMLEPSATEDLAHLDKALAMNGTSLITGIIDYQFASKSIYNALIGLGIKEPQDQHGQYFYPHGNRYFKHHLLPIGEFVPLEDILRPLAPLFDLPMSSFTRGNARQPNMRANGLDLVPAICYEIIFPRLLRQNIYNSSDFILTVSNDAWFGTSSGPLQHMQIAQMRALEFGRPVLRATNNGLTAITDEKGRIIEQLPQFEDAVLKADVKLVTGLTPYLRFGDWPIWILSLFGLGYVLFANRKVQRNEIEETL